MTNYNRISSIDIMRGLTLVLMLFVNDLYMKVATTWPEHQETNLDGIALADWIFPAFLFLVGMSIPFSFSKRFSRGDNLHEISRHIIIRFISLIIIGVLILNTGRMDAELTGISGSLWAILMFAGVFLIWNDYPDKENKFFTITGLRLIGMAILAFLIFKFKSGQPENNGSLITGWWGILGLIGWGYLAAAFAYVYFRDSIVKTALLTVFFLVMNILSGWNLIGFPDIIKTIFGVIIDGYVPFIVLSGLIAGLIVKKLTPTEHRKVIPVFIALGIFYLVAGFVLRNLVIISGVNGTPGRAMIFCGISLLVFILIYWIADVKKLTGWAKFIRPAGENSLTTYLAPKVIYYLIWSAGIPFFIYKESDNQLIVTGGSLIWSLLMILLPTLLARLKIKLKL